MTTLKERRERLGLTQGALAALVGTSQPQIRRLEIGERKLTKEWAERLAPHLQSSPEELVFGAPAARPLDDARRAELGAIKPTVLPTPDLDPSNDRSFPIYAAAEGGGGHMLVTFDPVERMRWPSILEGVRNAYGILIVGDSLAKTFRHGDLALVHPGLPPARDEIHVLYHTPPDGDAEAIIKNVLSWNDRIWRLEQFNPQREWEEHRADWPVAHRVVGRHMRR